MRNVLRVLATAVTIALLACGVAVADTVTTTFEPAFPLGSVNGHSGWKSAAPGAIPHCDPEPTGGEYDQRVVNNGLALGLGFGARSLRMSNLCGDAEFDFQTYSTPVPLESAAGETLPNTVYDAQFQFIPRTQSEQPGLYLTVSPDGYEGSRMSWVSLRDRPDGVHVSFSHSPEIDGEFEYFDVAVLNRTQPHTIRFWIKLIPGLDNDVLKLFIDGVDIGQGLGVCFTTWENYYPVAEEQAGFPNFGEPPDLRALQFRSSVQAPDPDALAQTGGYLFDNVTTTTGTGPGPGVDCSGGGTEPDIDIDKTTQTRSALPGQLITYRVTVRNRGDAPVRGVRACDRAPRALRFVGATTRLQRAARRRLCLTIRLLRPGQRKTFRATFRLRQTVTADTVTNGASADIPTASAPSPVPPEGAGNRPRRRRVDRDAATTRVRTTARACPAALNPRAHAAC